ncbi:hypothetical protein OSB04_023497 [Centaurea solstitialis]|uniref:Uncharacterized protein n=1 Tax=Centaurea solstitialis TaxID=347529 RepID=A0AA38SWP5_9ASTR|nr:hypothetical protein OSB04_023497 [Centaurea solstitialis]
MSKDIKTITLSDLYEGNAPVMLQHRSADSSYFEDLFGMSKSYKHFKKNNLKFADYKRKCWVLFIARFGYHQLFELCGRWTLFLNNNVPPSHFKFYKKIETLLDDMIT